MDEQSADLTDDAILPGSPRTRRSDPAHHYAPGLHGGPGRPGRVAGRRPGALVWPARTALAGPRVPGGVPVKRAWLFGLASLRRRSLIWLLLWSIPEALPTALSGLAVARAVDSGFLAGRPLV